MNLDLADRVIVVTGAASGIGLAIAQAAASEGATLFLTDRDDAGLTAAQALMPGCRTLRADLMQTDAPGKIVAAATASFGRIDGLVNAAGLTHRASVVDGTPDLWDALFTVNTRAAFFLMQGAVRDMLSRKAPGSIVNILSMNAHCGTPELAIYSATKGALATLTRNAANAHLADRIRVNGINLGWVATPAEDHLQTRRIGPDWQAQIAAAMPLGRLLTAQEAANLALFLLSDLSAPMTGGVIDLEQKVLGGNV